MIVEIIIVCLLAKLKRFQLSLSFPHLDVLSHFADAVRAGGISGEQFSSGQVCSSRSYGIQKWP